VWTVGRFELLLGAERQQGKRFSTLGRTFARRVKCRAEKETAAKADVAYRRLTADWRPLKKKKSACDWDMGREGQSRAADSMSPKVRFLLPLSHPHPQPETLSKETWIV
jgi:hypothetical protein